MSDLENMDVMLGAYSKYEVDSDKEDSNLEVDLESNRPRRDMIQNSKVSRSL